MKDDIFQKIDEAFDSLSVSMNSDDFYTVYDALQEVRGRLEIINRAFTNSLESFGVLRG